MPRCHRSGRPLKNRTSMALPKLWSSPEWSLVSDSNQCKGSRENTSTFLQGSGQSQKLKIPTQIIALKSGDSFEMQLPKEFWNKLSFLLELDLSDIGKDNFVFKSATRTGSPVSQTNVTKCIESTGFKTSFHGFRNAIKIWGRDNGYQDWLMDEYCQHALKGLDRSYRRATYLEQRSEVTDRLTAFVLNSSES